MKKYCKICAFDSDTDVEKCPVCGQNNFFPICNISIDDLININKASPEPSFLEAMIALHDTDIIEYELKMSQFRNKVDQQSKTETVVDNRPKCPICQSTNIQKIGGVERATSIAAFGIFSKKINKSFKCNNCGGTF